MVKSLTKEEGGRMKIRMMVMMMIMTTVMVLVATSTTTVVAQGPTPGACWSPYAKMWFPECYQHSNPAYICYGGAWVAKKTLPQGACGGTTTIPAPAAKAAPASTTNADGTTYVVQSGDTLSRIAARYGVTVAAITQANGIANPNRIYVGQVLVIPGGAIAVPAPAAMPAPASTTNADGSRAYFAHKVKRGDTLESIAHEYGVTVADIIAANQANHMISVNVVPGVWLNIPFPKR